MKNAEFKNTKLAQIYEDFNNFSTDEDFWLERIQELSPKHITDFWSGTGLFTCQLEQLGYSVTWIEPALPVLEIAKSKPNGNKIQWLHWSSEKLKDFKTDLVLLTSHVAQFLTHANDWKIFLTNSFNVLHSWGYIMFDSKNPVLKTWESYSREKYNRTKSTQFWDVNMQIELWEIEWNIVSHTIHYSFVDTWEELVSENTLIYRTKEEIEKDLREAGFRITQVYWDWDGDMYSPHHSEMIFLAQKP